MCCGYKNYITTRQAIARQSYYALTVCTLRALYHNFASAIKIYLIHLMIYIYSANWVHYHRVQSSIIAFTNVTTDHGYSSGELIMCTLLCGIFQTSCFAALCLKVHDHGLF